MAGPTIGGTGRDFPGEAAVPKPGDIVDRYRVERFLGEGGMASVYQVTHAALGSPHALKVLRPDLVTNDDLRGRFLAEGQIQAQLRHPNIVAATDIVALPDVAGIVMEYVEGPSLEEYIEAQDAALPLEEQLAVMLPLLDAVGYAHDQGVVHRDLKPSNVVLALSASGDVRPVVLDFGIAKLAEDADVAHRKKKTRTGVRMGTVYYMSPEQIRGAADVDRRTDVFALGAILYELTTGWLAFDAEGDFEIMQRIVSGQYEPLPVGPAAPHPVIQSCIAKALAADPARRFPDCETFVRTLRTAWRGSVPPRLDATRVRYALGLAGAPEHERARAGQIKSLRRKITRHQQALDWRGLAGALEQLVQLEPDVPDHREALIDVCLRLNQPDKVAAHLEGLSQLMPDRTMPLERLAEYHLGQGQHDEAIAVFGRLAELEPRERSHLDRLVTLLEKADRPGAVLDVKRRLLEIAPDDPDVRADVADACRAAGDDAGAEQEYRAVLAHNPGHARARYQLGLLRHERLADGESGSFAEVTELLFGLHIEGGLRDDAERTRAHLYLCSARLRSGADDSEMSNELLNLEEGLLVSADRVVLGDCWWRVGEQLVESGDYDGALSAYDNASRLGMQNQASGRLAELYLTRGDDLIRRGKLAQARELLATASAYVDDESQIAARMRRIRFRSIRRWVVLAAVVVPIAVLLALGNYLAKGKPSVTLTVQPDPVGGAWGTTLPRVLRVESDSGRRVNLVPNSMPKWNATTATYRHGILRSGTWTIREDGEIFEHFDLDSREVSVPLLRLTGEDTRTLTAQADVTQSWGVIQIGEMPAGTRVYINMAKASKTPFTYYAAVGKHVVTVSPAEGDGTVYEFDIGGSEVATVP